MAGVSWSLAAGDGVQLAADAGGTAPTHDAKAEKTGVGKKREDNFWRQKTQKHENMDLKRVNRVGQRLSHTKIWQSVHHVLMPQRRCPLVVHVWNSQDNLNSLEF